MRHQKFVEQIPENLSFEVILTFEKNILNDIPIEDIDSIDKINNFSNENLILNTICNEKLSCDALTKNLFIFKKR
jgi:hypothetical protein